MNKPDSIIVHCSDSEWGDTNEIRKWHLAKGWRDIGYHFVILNARIKPDLVLAPLNGSIEVARPLEEEGAHCLGYNDHSIGICAIAKEKWTDSQEISMVVLLRELQRKFSIPTERILGHCETVNGRKEGKICPNHDMNRIRDLVDGRRI